MELEYEKKDLTKSPKVKQVVKLEVPEDCRVFEKGGNWIAVDVKGNKSKWGSEQEAIEWLTK